MAVWLLSKGCGEGMTVRGSSGLSLSDEHLSPPRCEIILGAAPSEPPGPWPALSQAVTVQRQDSGECCGPSAEPFVPEVARLHRSPSFPLCFKCQKHKTFHLLTRTVLTLEMVMITYKSQYDL